eukprot:4301019-Amphidinium_carterae.1
MIKYSLNLLDGNDPFSSMLQWCRESVVLQPAGFHLSLAPGGGCAAHAAHTRTSCRWRAQTLFIRRAVQAQQAIPTSTKNTRCTDDWGVVALAPQTCAHVSDRR